MVNCDTVQLIRRATQRRTRPKKAQGPLKVVLAKMKFKLSAKGSLKSAFCNARARKVERATGQALCVILNYLKDWAQRSILQSNGATIHLVAFVGNDNELQIKLHKGGVTYAALKDAPKPSLAVCHQLARELCKRLPDIKAKAQEYNWHGTMFRELEVSWNFE
jgi:hypothetical protein